MKMIGIFEVKTRLSQICEEVAASGETVTVTKRGKPLVCIGPIDEQPMTIRERRAAYMAEHGAEESADAKDFGVPARSRDPADFTIEEPEKTP